MSKSKLYLAIGFGTLGLLLSAGCFAALGVIQSKGGVYPDTLKTNEAAWIRTQRDAGNINSLNELSAEQRKTFLLDLPVSNEIIFAAYRGEAADIDLSTRSEFTVFGTLNYPSYVLTVDEIKAVYPEAQVTFWNNPGGNANFVDDNNGYIFYEYQDGGVTRRKIVNENDVTNLTITNLQAAGVVLRAAPEVSSTLETFNAMGIPTAANLANEVRAISSRLDSSTSQAETTGIVLTVVASIALGSGALLGGYIFYRKSKGKEKKGK